jgi:hypothetical protein
MRTPSVHSQAEQDAIGQLIGPTGQLAFLGAERLDDMSWRWRDGTPWDFEAWDSGQPTEHSGKDFLTINWKPSSGVVWQDMPGIGGVVCVSPSISAIKGAVPTILRLGGPKNAEIIATGDVGAKEFQ